MQMPLPGTFGSAVLVYLEEHDILTDGRFEWSLITDIVHALPEDVRTPGETAADQADYRRVVNFLKRIGFLQTVVMDKVLAEDGVHQEPLIVGLHLNSQEFDDMFRALIPLMRKSQIDRLAVKRRIVEFIGVHPSIEITADQVMADLLRAIGE